MPAVRRRMGWVLAGLAVLLLGAPSRAADEAAIKRAIDRGAKALKGSQAEDGNWDGNRHGTGGTALVALALLEAGVPADDPGLQKAIRVVREAAIRESQTYQLSLSIMLCDRLGTPADTALIQSMAIRLIAGQGADGGWTYDCPTSFVDDAEVRRLKAILDKKANLVAQPKPPEPTKPDDPPAAPPKPALAPEIDKQLRTLDNAIRKDGLRPARSDNSNTQFGLMAAWIARRHGAPTDAALVRVGARFRNSQAPFTGGWGYTVKPPAAPAMTCAGLLGLAVAYGVEVDLRARPGPPAKAPPAQPKPKPAKAKPALEPGKDPAIRAALLYLGGVLLANKEPLRGELPRVVLVAGNQEPDLYFMWSLERVAVAYGLSTIGEKDWYAWGSDALVATQRPNGTWKRSYGSDIDTAFALLFLRRANLATDLTGKLRGKVSDPGKATLTAGVGLPGKPTDPAPPGPEVKPVPALPQGESARLSQTLLNASGDEQAELILLYKDRKGAAYTDALALALPKLTGDTQKTARAALTERLSRMSAATLRDKLTDTNVEVRRSAALACGTKGDREHVPDLIAALEDREMHVRRAARIALRHLTDQDFGPAADAPAPERAKAIADWKKWWAKQPK